MSRSALTRLATHAYSRGLLQRDAIARALDITPDEDLESVLAFFEVDPPDDSATRAA